MRGSLESLVAHEAFALSDARSDTQGIRLSMPNPEKRDSGLHVIVELPSDVAAANNPQGIAGSGGPPLGQ